MIGLEAKMVPTKVDGKNFGSKITADCWYVIHTASGRVISPQYCVTKEQAEAYIAQIYAAIPEADWTRPVADLVKIPNLQVRIINAGTTRAAR